MVIIELDDSDLYVETSFTDESIKLMRKPYTCDNVTEEWYIKSISGEKYYWDIAVADGEIDCYKAVAEIDDVSDEEIAMVIDAITALRDAPLQNTPDAHDPFADMSNYVYH